MLKLLGIGPNTHFPREKVKGADDNSRTVEEPDAVKVACPVLVRRESRAFSANGAFDWEAVFPGGSLSPCPYVKESLTPLTPGVSNETDGKQSTKAHDIDSPS